MTLIYRNALISDVSNKYFLLSNTKKIIVYALNGKKINEFKTINTSSILLIRDKIFFYKINKKILYSINIRSGIQEKVSFNAIIDGIVEMYTMSKNILLLVIYRNITNKDGILEYCSGVLIYNIEKKSYTIYMMENQEIIKKIIFYNRRAYLVCFPSNHREKERYIIYKLNKNGLKLCQHVSLSINIQDFDLSSDGKYFVYIDKKDKKLKIFDINTKKEIFFYSYQDMDYAYLGKVFEFNKNSYIYIYDSFKGNILINDNSREETTYLFDLKTGLIQKELKDLYRIFPLNNHLILFEVQKYLSNSTKVYLENLEE